MANHTNWLNISSQSGSSGQTILTLSANRNLSTNYKTAEITAYNPVYNISAKTYVTIEAYSPYIELSPTIIPVADSGGTFELSISANCSWVIAYPDLVSSYSTTAGTGDRTITFSVPSTTADTTLVGNIVVTDESGQVSRTARIEQYGSGAHIGIFPVELYFDSTGGSQTFSVTADCAYNVSMASGADWARVTPNSGYTGQTTFTVTVNSGYTGDTQRSTTVLIDAPGVSGLVAVYQNKPETRLIVGYYVTSTTEPTYILKSSSGFTSAEYPDGTQIPLETGYTFPSTGIQYVYYTLADNTTIGSSVFGNSTQPNADLVSIVVPSGVTTIGSAAFWYCSSLTSLTLPDTITSIPNSMVAECTSLSSITIPDSVTQLNGFCFLNCTSLSSITVPSGVTYIGSGTFNGSSVSSITFTSLTPPTLQRDTAISSSSLTEIIVPCPAVNDYITAWPQYAQYISCSETGTTLYFVTDTSNVKGIGETRTITILNTNINPNRTGLNLPSDFPQQGSYFVVDNVIYLTYPRNPSSSATRSWTIGVVAQTNDGVSLSGSYQITQNAYNIVQIPYTADTSTVDVSGETRTITIDTSNLVASSITIGVEGMTGVTYTYNNGIITIVFPENTDGYWKDALVTVTGIDLQGNEAISEISFKQSAGPSEYFTIEVLSTNGSNPNIKFLTESSVSGSHSKTIQYRKNGNEWQKLTSVVPDYGQSQRSATIYVAKGDIIEFKGDNGSYYTDTNDFNYFCSNGARVDVRGNIMSLVNSTGFSADTTIRQNYAFAYLFSEGKPGGNRLNIRDASGLLLPATNLTEGCYKYMFNYISLLVGPKMLPATILANKCYYGMFYGCNNLVTSPKLPAATLLDYCYEYMFYGCRSLSSITCYATIIAGTNCTTSWTHYVADTGTFITPAAAQWTTGEDGIPSGWTRVNSNT